MDSVSSEGNLRKSRLDWMEVGEAVTVTATVMMMKRRIGDGEFAAMVAINRRASGGEGCRDYDHNNQMIVGGER